MIKDALGNDLAKGDILYIPLPISPVGKIISLNEGGLVIGKVQPGKPMTMSAGELKVMIEVNIGFNPTKQINVFKLMKSDFIEKMEKQLVNPPVSEV